ncbi:MAG: hypothetical protein ABEJ31_05950 [Haloarculaceae archaeon]
MKRVVAMLAVVALCLSGSQVALGAAAVDAGGQQDSAGHGPTVTATATRVGGTQAIRYRVTVDPAPGADRVTLRVGRTGRIVGGEGFSRRMAGGQTRLRLTDPSAGATVVLRAAADGAAAADSPEYVDAGDWLLGPVPFLEVAWSAPNSGRVHRRYPLRQDGGRLANQPDATFGDRYALFGPQTSATRRADGHRIRLVRPRGTTVAAGTDEVLDTLSTAAQQFRVGDRGDDVLVFALPSPARRGGESIPARDESWVNAAEPVDDANSVWLHEYVHTRQDFALAADMQWFREASAEYYAARLAQRQGRITEAAVRRHLGGSAVTATLTRPRTWSDRRVPYTKGARVLALLDHNIRETTNGRRSLQDVFRRLNARDGPITYAAFAAIVADVAGHPMDGWLDRYVAGSTPVAGIYHGGPSRSGFVSVEGALAAERGPGLVFFALAVGLSALASIPLYGVLSRLDGEREPAGATVPRSGHRGQ